MLRRAAPFSERTVKFRGFFYCPLYDACYADKRKRRGIPSLAIKTIIAVATRNVEPPNAREELTINLCVPVIYYAFPVHFECVSSEKD